MFYHAAFPKYATYAESGPMIVLPISKDDGVKNLVFAMMLSAAGFYFGTSAVAHRLDDKK